MSQTFEIVHFSSGQSLDLNQQRYKKPKTQNNYKKSSSLGIWSQKQTLMYVIFIDFFRSYLYSKSNRRNSKIFKTMSNFLGTRNSVQCRTHHQKLLNKFKSIGKIVSNLKIKFNLILYNQKFTEYTTSYKEIFSIDQQKPITKEENLQVQEIAVQTDIQPYNTQINKFGPYYQIPICSPQQYFYINPYYWTYL